MLLWTMQGLLVASATDHSRVRCVRARPEIVYVCCVSVCVCVCVCVHVSNRTNGRVMPVSRSRMLLHLRDVAATTRKLPAPE
jgi:hypothetical protein